MLARYAYRSALIPHVKYSFSTSATALKKKGGSPPNTSTNESADSSSFDSSKMKASLESMLETFSIKVKEAKNTTVNAEKFTNLNIDLGQGSSSTLKSLATVAARGNKINIVAFDPKQLKRIETAIISQLNMPAVKQDKQTLSVVIPQQTDSKKSASALKIKEAFESLRNNSGNRESIASIRAKYLAPLKKAASKGTGVSKDDVKKQTQEIEQLVKVYSNKLQDLYKQSQ